MNRQLIIFLLAPVLMFVPLMHAHGEDASENSTNGYSFLTGNVRFSWGVDVGSSIDLTSQDMSSINADAYLGLRTPYTDIVGFGAGIHTMVGNSSFTYPIYALVRTSFAEKPRLCFLDLRLGLTLNNFFDSSSKPSIYVNPALGVHLKRGNSYLSYLALGYEYNSANSPVNPDTGKSLKPISMVNVRLGISF